MSNGRMVETFHIALGRHAEGTKQQEGDGRTPEGRYLLDYRNAASAFHKSIHVACPNRSDQASAKRRGVQPGGMIMLHGQKNGWGLMGAATQRMDWTDGCIALTDQDMDRVWKLINVPTPIQIDP